MKHKTVSKMVSFILALAMMAIVAVLPASAAQLSTAQTSYGFFQSVGAGDALKILNNSTFTPYMHQGDPNDATSLENMLKGLDLVEATNQKRAAEGLAPLKVTDSLMAMAQANVNYSAVKNGHAGVFNETNQVLDNLAFGMGQFAPADAVNSWYGEKQNVPQGADDQWLIQHWMDPDPKTVGHYGTMMSRGYANGYTVAGGAYNHNSKARFSEVYDMTVGPNASSNETAYTVDQYRARLQNYINQVK